MRAEGKITMMDLNVRENVHAHVPCIEGGGGRFRLHRKNVNSLFK